MEACVFEAVRAAVSLVDQSVRYVVDRTHPARSMPKNGRDVTPEWMARARGLRPGDESLGSAYRLAP